MISYFCLDADLNKIVIIILTTAATDKMIDHRCMLHGEAIPDKLIDGRLFQTVGTTMENGRRAKSNRIVRTPGRQLNRHQTFLDWVEFSFCR